MNFTSIEALSLSGAPPVAARSLRSPAALLMTRRSRLVGVVPTVAEPTVHGAPASSDNCRFVHHSALE